MKLYYKSGACSLASHIALREAGSPFELESVDFESKKTESGADYFEINPKGYVPALGLDDGQVLTEGAAILQYIADQNPDANLAPKPGTLERVRLQEALNFISAEFHKSFSPLFNPAATAETKEAAIANIGRKLDHLETVFADGRPYMMGEQFTVADAYLFTIAGWTNFCGIDLGKWPNVAAFVGRVAAREKAQEALRAEGLAA